MPLSIVIPIHNEEPSILPLYDRLTAVLERLRKPYEIIFVDDASTDRSFDLLANLVETDARLKVIRLRRNFGQTAALAAGFDEAQGTIVISLDGDLQHAPEDIPALLEKIDEGYDIASGWRKNRVDNAVTRKHPVAHRQLADGQGLATSTCATSAPPSRPTARKFSRTSISTASCTASSRRWRRCTARASPRCRSATFRAPSGGSHYGLGRTFRVMFDIFTIWFLLKYFTRPMHFFGKWGLISAGVGRRRARVAGRLEAVDGGDIIAEHGPLMVAGALALVTGVILFCTGLLGEVLTRTYFESQGRRIYAVREIRTKRETSTADGTQGAHGSRG